MSFWDNYVVCLFFKHFAHVACLPPTARLEHQHASTQWPLPCWRATAFSLLSSPLLTPPPHRSSPHAVLTCRPVVIVVVVVCQLVNARCTAADKDQKDITNNRLLTGERDTQVPPRNHPLPSLPSFSLPHLPAARSRPLHLTTGGLLHSKTLALLRARRWFLASGRLTIISSLLHRHVWGLHMNTGCCRRSGWQHGVA